MGLTTEEIERIVAAVPGGVRNIQDIYPLAPLQEGILFHHLLVKEGDPYLLHALIRFDTRSRLNHYLTALQAVIDRHDILRTAIVWEGLTEPAQVVLRRAPLLVEEIVLDPSSVDGEEQLRTRFSSFHYRMDIRRAPLMRAMVAHDAARDRWLMLLLFHHVVCDHVTLEAIQEEIRAHMCGKLEQLPQPLPFRNFVAQARLGVSREDHEAFFREMLSGVDEVTAPFGLTDVSDAGQKVTEARLFVEPLVCERLRSSARSLGVSTASIMHVAWARVLAAIAGREDVVFGTVLFGRMNGNEGADRALGLFINTLPVRVGIDRVGVAESVKRTHALLARLLHHEHASLALAQRCSNVMAPQPLFNTLLNYRHSRHVLEANPSRAMEGIEPVSVAERATYPVVMAVDDLGETFALTAQVHDPLDPELVCALMHETLNGVLAALEQAPESPLREVRVLPEEQRQRLLVEWNATGAPYPSEACVHEIFEAQVERTPDAVAVVYEQTQLTYAELNEKANQLARYLREHGVQADTRVALCLERSVEMVVSLLAVLKAGGAYVPLDPSYPVERLKFMLEACTPVLVLTHERVGSPVRAMLSESGASLVEVGEETSVWSQMPSQALERGGLSSEHPAYIIYTSGSTGEPKGVIVQHRALVNLVQWSQNRWELRSDDALLQKTPFGFDAAVWEFWWPLLYGAKLVMAAPQGHRDAHYLALVMQREGITTLQVVPSQLQVLLEERALSQCTSLKRVVCGGEALTQSLVRQFQAMLPWAELHNVYGPTEATVDATAWECTDSMSDSVPIGRPIANTRVYVLDEWLEPVPVGVTGELYIGGAGVAHGYWNRPDLTAERFIASPFVDGDRLYKTGDLGRWLPDGSIEFVGRNDFQVKIRGFRIELGEIESRLREHAHVRDAVVLAREDNGEKRLVAYCTPSPEEILDAHDLRAYLLERLPEYMVPAAYVLLDELPLTPNGKLDRKALPAPDGGAFAASAYEAPQGATEAAIAQIWCEVLGVDRVGRHDNFFELGGHSLLAVRMISRVRQVVGVEASLTALFGHPVLHAFARVVAASAQSTLPAIEPVDRAGVIPASYAQQRLWFLAQMDGVSEAYHIPGALHLRGHLDVRALRRSLDRIVERHEALRTTFEIVDGEPVQRIGAAEIGFALVEHDLRDRADARGAVDAYAAEEARAPFDIARGPLVRGQLLRVADDEHVLLITMHHIVSDGWSVGVLLRELRTLYDAYTRGAQDPLPVSAVQYADYAVWQRRWFTGSVLGEQSAYWQGVLAGAPQVLALPTDRARPAQQDHRGGRIAVELDAELSAGLKALSQRHGTTLFMTLLSAWTLLLSRLSGEDDVVVGTPVANRTRAEIEELIGFFVNTLALRVDCSGNPRVSELLARVKARTLDAQMHQDLPFEQVVELVKPVRSLAHTPLFQVMFAWQNAEAVGFSLPGVDVVPLGSAYPLAKFDLTLNLGETDERIAGTLEYAAALFDEATIRRYASYFDRVVRAMVADDEQRIERIGLLDERERDQVLVAWNATDSVYPSESCVHELFEAQVERTPDAVAVVYERTQLTYAELNARANRLARYLREQRVEPDARVALCFERSVEMVVSLLAVLKAGGAYVPLDSSYPLERLRYMLEDSAPVVVLTHGAVASDVRELLAQGGAPMVDVDADASRWSTLDARDLDRAGLTPAHLAYIIYTSGSTGQPKGVMIEHQNVANYLRWASTAYAPVDGSLVSSSISFDATITSLLLPLNCGGVVELLPEHRAIEVLEARLKDDANPGLIKITPAHLDSLGRQLTEHPALENLFVIGGEALTSSTVALWRRLQPGARLVNEYGPTEATVGCAVYEVPNDLPEAQPIPIGRPIANARIYIVGESLEPVPVGVTGELYIGGAGVARGYWNRPDLTAERFIPSPFIDGDRLYKTGDLGRWLPDGAIEYLGRNDFQVKIRGFRIELGEVESRLREHAHVRDAVVLARDESGEKRLVAYCMPAGDDAFDAHDLRAYLLERLPEYMVPAAYVLLDEMPLTPNGKVDRKALPAPDGDAYAARAYEEPQGATEAAIAQIWSEVLGVDRVGRHDNFFELGGHSLLAVRMISRVRQVVGVEASLTALFGNPVLHAFARVAGASVQSTLPAIEPVNRAGVIPASYAQQRLWFLAQMDGVSEAYHIPGALHLCGKLDVRALRRALDRIVERHEALRTTFEIVDGEPVQCIGAAESGFVLVEHDLRVEADARSTVDACAAEEARAPFDIAQGPLIRGRLLRIADDEHVLLITMHHIVSDGWSMGVLLRELRTLYDAYARGAQDPLPVSAVQYADYAVWQRRWLSGSVLAEQSAYWQRMLAGAPQVLALPTDRPRPAQQDHRGGCIAVELDAELSAALKALGQRHGTTLFMTLLSAWTVLLSRLSGEDDVVVGTPVANRTRAEVEELIGFFVNTLALRVDCSGNPRVSELLARVKARTLEAQMHQDLPFEQVVELVKPVRSLAHTPLFQVMFAWQNAEAAGFSLPGIDVAPLGSAYPLAKFDLTLNLVESENRIAGTLEYAAALFDESTVRRYVSYFERIVRAMVLDDEQRIERIALLDERERNQVLVAWNTTDVDYSPDRCIHELFEEQAASNPTATAVVFGDASLSYDELNARANQVAHRLRDLGVGPDHLVGLCVERGLEMLVGLLGILKAGGAYVPLDPSYPSDRLAHMIRDSAPVAVLTHAGVSASVRALFDDVAVVDLDHSFAAYSSENPDRDGLTPEHLAYVIYTSGSTGQPKGVMVEHRNVVRLLSATQPWFGIGPSDVWTLFHSYAFDFSVWEIWGALAHGGRLVIVPHLTTRSPQEFLELLAREGVTILNQTPSAFRALIAAQDREPHRLRAVIFGGEALDPAMLKPWCEKTLNQSTRLINMYGITETTVHVTYYPLTIADTERLGRSPIGRPIPDLNVYILDERLEPVPIGVAGELYVGGAGVARGYLHRAKLTAERFIASPFVEGDRLYKTGDLGRWLPDGSIEYLGRNDFQVKIRGFRIELGEIESYLREHAHVRDAVVLARDESGEKRLVAYCTPSGDDAFDAHELRAYLLERLPEYMVPAAYVLLDELPLTPNGKVDRKALPAPDGDAYAARAYEEPQGALETAIAQIWSEVLGIDRVGRHDNFFELGGHSLLAVRMISRVRQVVGVEASLTALFGHPVLHAFARVVAASGLRTLPVIEPVDRAGMIPASYAQQRLWFLAQMDGVSEAYHIPGALHLRGKLDVRALRRALDRIVERHEALRTTFEIVDGEPVQRIGAAEIGFALVEHDLRDRADARGAVDAYAAEEARAPFDIARGPLVRGQLLRVADDEHVLLITMHHIVSDGWSVGVLLRELRTLYDAYTRGEHDPLPVSAVQYADYAVWQRRWLTGTVLAEQSGYWQGMLAGAPQVLALPTDRARPAQQDHRGGRITVELDAELSALLKTLSQRHGTTLFMTLLSAWTLLLSRLSGEDDVVVGTPIANRTRAEIEELIGFFVNTLALRIDCSGNPRVSELLARVKARTLEAQMHQDLPFEQVVELVKPVRSLAHTPLFQVMFAWQNAEVAGFSLPGIDVVPLGSAYPLAKFDLTLNLVESEDRIAGTLEYAAALFDESTVRRYASYFERVVRAMVADDEQRIERIALLGERERNQLLVEWNATDAPYPKDACLHERFEAQVERTPDAVAVVYERTQLTYAELNARANQLARYLREQGVQPDARVALCFERSVEMVVSLLAVLKAGGAYVPLDSSYPVERLRYMLEDSAPAVVLTHGAVAGDVREVLAQSGTPMVDVDTDASRWSMLDARDLERAGLTPAHLAYIIYTSGSTGQPKGAMIEHGSIVNRLQWMQDFYGLSADDAILQKTPWGFDVSVWEFFWPLLNGAKLVVARPDGHKDPAYLAALIQEQHVTTVHFVPSMLSLFLDYAPSIADSNLKRVVCSGEALPGSVARRMHRALPNVSLSNLYGPTEAAVDVTAWVCDPEADSDTVPIGRPIANTRIYVLDESLEPVPVGVSGELYIGGVQVARGYWNRPDLTAQRFIASPFVDGDRLYKTGDLARWLPDGSIEFIGRNDFQVKIRGFRIELGEIEARLLEHAHVRDAVVLAREESGEKRLVAYCTPSGEDALDTHELRAHLLERLPEYMVPAAYVLLDELPLTPNGKVDRKALPAPDGDAYAAHEYEEPQGEVETAIARIWSEVLGVDRVGRHDNFFELGGHSLLVIRVIERLRRLDMHAEVQTFFTVPTLAQLAAQIGRCGDQVTVPPNGIPAQCERITPQMLPLVSLSESELARVVQTVHGGAANVQDIYPLAPLQEGILFHHLLQSRGDTYILRTLLRFESRARADAFVEALQAVVNRHDILRTAVVSEGLSEPVQVVWRHAPLAVETLEFSEGDTAEQLLARFDPATYRMDVCQAPLLRVVLARDPKDQQWVMLLLLHHLVDDNTSIKVLFAEIRAHLSGDAEHLPPTQPFRNFVAQARLGMSREQHEVFFREMLGNVSEPTLPFGLSQVHGDGTQIAQAHQLVDAQLSRRLRAQARLHGVTTATLCHVAWGRVLGLVSGQRDVVFGTVLFGRMQGGEGAERALGLYINTLPIRVALGEHNVRESVRQTHALLAQVLRHEHASLVLAQRCSAVAPTLPLFSAVLNYRHGGEDRAQRSPALAGIEVLGSQERTNYPFGLSVDDLGDGFGLTAQVQQPLDPEAVCALMHTALEGLVEALERAPETRLLDVRVLPEGQRRLVLSDWNATDAPYPTEACLHELFEGQVERTPDAVAVVYGQTQLTYAELNARANRLARYLREQGVQPDARVALCFERSAEMVVSLLAVLKAGGAYVPLDSSYPLERLRYMLEDSAPAVVLTHGAVASDVRELLAQSGAPVVDVDADADRWSMLDGRDLERSGLKPTHLAYIIYTSGSTGQPKGAMIEHGSIVNRLQWMQDFYGLSADDTILQKTPWGFDVSVWEFFWPLLNGAKLVVARPGGHKDPAYLAALIHEQRVTTVHFVPSMLSLFLDYGPSIADSNLRRVICSGEALSGSIARRMHKALPNVALSNLYGPTEAAVDVTAWVCDPEADSDTVPIGRPIANTRIYVLDESLEPVPVGVAGELYIGGVQVARGYWNRPDLTVQRFIASPFVDGDRLYKTGDLARWLPDGSIEFIGRNDFQVKIRGFRIELGEIEARLLEHAQVRDAVVLAREEHGEKRLVAYCTPSGEGILDAHDLRAYLLERLPEYMVPAAYVLLDELPLTPNGKVDRKALPAPDGDAYAAHEYEEPQGAVETAIAQVWSEVLGIDRVGRHDNFFELGGHSLLLLRMRQPLGALGFDVDVPTLYKNPTVATLADVLRAERPLTPVATSTIVPVRTTGTQTPIFLAHEFFGLDLYFPIVSNCLALDIPVYGLPGVPLEEPQLRTIEGMASRMIRSIREIQPVGPYRVAGWCFGGILAYEIAVQLLGQDEHVEFVGLVDTYNPAVTKQPGVFRKSPQALLLEGVRENRALTEEQSSELARIERAAEETSFQEVLQACRQTAPLPNVVSAYNEDEEIERFYVRLAAHFAAREDYVPQAISIPIHLFVAEDQGAATATGPKLNDGFLGWASTLPRTQIEKAVVPGDHFSMLGAHADALGAAVSDALARTSGRRPTPSSFYQPHLLVRSAHEDSESVFCVPGAGDSVFGFVHLAEALDAHWTVHGFQPRGLSDVLEPHSTVEAAAAAYVRALNDAYPRGPVHLLGHSFGGWVALEMAHRLSEAGRTVGSLSVVDTEAPMESNIGPELTSTEVMMEWLGHLELLAGRSLGIDAHVLEPLDERARLRLAHERLVQAGVMPSRSRSQTLHGALRTFSSAIRTGYRPAKPYPGAVHVVVVDDARLDAAANERRHADVLSRWQVAAPNIAPWRGPGNHLTIMRDPHVSQLAAWWLSRRRESSEPGASGQTPAGLA